MGKAAVKEFWRWDKRKYALRGADVGLLLTAHVGAGLNAHKSSERLSFLKFDHYFGSAEPQKGCDTTASIVGHLCRQLSLVNHSDWRVTGLALSRPLRSGLSRRRGLGRAIKEGDTGKGHRSPSERRSEDEEGSPSEGGGTNLEPFIRRVFKMIRLASDSTVRV